MLFGARVTRLAQQDPSGCDVLENYPAIKQLSGRSSSSCEPPM
jgi:hypothetical protein